MRPFITADELAGDVEAEAGTADAARELGIEAIELLEDPVVLEAGIPRPSSLTAKRTQYRRS